MMKRKARPKEITASQFSNQSGGTFIAVIQHWLGSYEEPDVRSITANSLTGLANRLRDPDLMQVEGYHDVVKHVLYQLFPDDPDNCEMID
jgi:hypothetical protein